MTRPLNKIREEFIEQIGIAAQDDGMPRIAGRLMGLMIFDGEKRSFSDLAKELKVSRGSISTNARLLQQLGVIEKVGVPGDRQEYYQLGENPYQMILQGAGVRARKQHAYAKKISAILPTDSNGTQMRLKEYEQFYDALSTGIEDIAENLREKKE